MGSVCTRAVSVVPTSGTIKDLVPAVIEQSLPPDLSDPDKSPPSTEEILDDNFKTEIEEAIGECIASVPIAYRAERDRIVAEMRRSAPQTYLGLLFSEYPDVNGPTVNQMAYKLATSKESKQQLSDKVNDRIEPSFQSRTASWHPLVRGMARPVVTTFVEKTVAAAVDNLVLE